MREQPLTDAVTTIHDPETGEDGYDPDKGRVLAEWVWELKRHDEEARKSLTSCEKWDKRWAFINGDQWTSGDMPSYRRPVKMNVLRRAIHQAMSVLTGDRPMLKIIPSGGPITQLDPLAIPSWQAALWGTMRQQRAMRRYADAVLWALSCDGGWLKVGWGANSPLEQEDWRVAAPHPKKVLPDPECVDVELAECTRIALVNVYDLAPLTRKFPEQGWRVKPDGSSDKWASKERPSWFTGPGGSASGISTITPAGNWSTTSEHRRAKAEVVELWIDDSSIVFETHNGDGGKWNPKYPYGRLITCTKDVVLRDIPNPFGPLWGWARRWPFIFVPGAESPNCLWRPGMLSDQEELQRSVNKMLSLLIENAIKVSNALVIADEAALDDEDWDLLSLVPGAKIRKRQGQEFKVVFPEPLPEYCFKLPDYLGSKIEAALGIQDPNLPAGQAVAARTVQFLMQKGNFVLGCLAELGDDALARLGERVIGIMRGWYQPGRMIPYFEGESLKGLAPLPGLPPALQLRVEPGSAWAEIQASGELVAEAEAKSRNQGSRAAGEPRT